MGLRVLRDHEDAFGHFLRDALAQRGRGFHVVERDDGYIDVSGLEGYLATFRNWPPHHRRAMGLVRGRVLDVGCGAGRHALHLQQKGFDVVGIDVSPLAVRVCRTRGLRHVRLLPVTRIGATLGRFDTILMLGNNFGLLGNARRTRWLLRRFHAIATPRARIIAETLDPYETTNPLHLAYHRRNRRRGRMSGQVRIRVRYQRYATPWFDYLFVSEKELRGLIAGTGWTVARLIRSTGPIYIAVLERDAGGKAASG